MVTVNGNSGLACQLTASDDEVDALHHETGQLLKQRMRAAPEQIDGLPEHFHAARLLERISDHASNIAEDMIYLTEGEIVRHRNGGKTEQVCASTKSATGGTRI